MALHALKVFGAFEKLAPGLESTTIVHASLKKDQKTICERVQEKAEACSFEIKIE